MSVQMVCCPKCQDYHNEVVREHNPGTKDANMDVTLRCKKCGHEWEGRVTSHHHKEMYAQGWVI